MKFIDWVKQGYQNKEVFGVDFELKLNLNALSMQMENLSRFKRIKHKQGKENASREIKNTISQLKKLI